ncbi:MAG: CPXCG motif-containing cysteine-rich protein [Oscillochloris sp.]|nr:CPXCG motif-containing cysteine-rich protein [Oscillochloris sp.]
MSEQRGVCPFCAHVAAWRFSGVSVSLPPTGGDYEWAEVEASTGCPACAQPIAVRVRVDLDDYTVDRLISSPMPQTAEWRRYVAATINRHAANLVTVQVFAVAEDVATVQQALEKHGGEGHLSNLRRTVLELSQAGYREPNGAPLHASAQDAIHYDPLGLR